MSKKVLFVISSLGGGGAERVLLNIANEMVTKGVDVKILKTGSKNITTYEISQEIEVIQAPKYTCNKMVKAILLLHFIREVFKRNNEYTVVSFLSDNNILSLIASAGLKNKVVVCERNDPSQNCGNELLRKIRNFLYLFADWSIFQTQDMKEYFCKAIQRKGTVIPNPVFIDRELVNMNASVKQNRIIAAGRLTKQKNYPMLFKAFELLHIKFPEYQLEIYGDGELKEQLEDMIRDMQLSGAIKINPYTSNIHQLMVNSKMYVSSSDYEGISNTMLEAMALGVPTIVTDCPVGGGKMVINNGENGILVRTNDCRGMADAMEKIISDECFQKKLSANSVAVIDKYALSKITDKWIEVL